MKAPIYTRYIIQAYQEAAPDLSMIKDSAKVEVFADNEVQAIEAAKKLITKNHYRISEVGQFYYDLRIDGYKSEKGI